MLTPFLFSVCLYFFYWLINHGGLVGNFIQEKIIPKLPEKVQYALKCSFCFCFWLAAIVVPFAPLSWWVIFVAPVYGLFINLLYLSLTQP